MRNCTISDLTPSQLALVEAAVAVLPRAYSPYSGLRVGAALRCGDGAIVAGTNLENASYGLSICAERVALASANSQGCVNIHALAVTASGSGLAADGILPPCGACRQVITEAAQRAGRDIEILLASPDKSRIVITSSRELLPLAMGGDGFGAALETP